MSGIEWLEAVQCANLSFASDRFLFISRRVASFHLGAGNSRLLLTDKFNLNLQYCMLGINKCFFYYFKICEAIECYSPNPLGQFRTEQFSHPAF